MLSLVNDKHFSDWLQEQLISNNLTQADLARAAGLSRAAISNLINQQRHPGPEALIAIADALQLPPELVFRQAGLLPNDMSQRNVAEQIAAYKLDELTETQLDEVLQFIEFISSYLLSGLSYCARCGSPHFGLSARQPSGDYYRRYACTRAKRARDCDATPIPANVLEAAVLQELRARILDPDHLDQLRLAVLSGHRRRQDDLAARRRSLVKDLAAIRRQISRITTAIADAGHSRSLLSKLSTLEAEEAGILAAIQKVELARQDDSAQLEILDHAALSADLRRRLESQEPHELRQILRGLVQRVLVDRDGPQITGQVIYYYPPESPPPKA